MAEVMTDDEMLAKANAFLADPAVKYGVFTRHEPRNAPLKPGQMVEVAICIRGSDCGIVRIPREKYDGLKLIEALERAA